VPETRKTDAELMAGNPAHVAADPAVVVDTGLVEVELGGQKVMVTSDVASALEAQARAQEEQLARLRSDTQRQLQEIRQNIRPAQPATPAPPDEESAAERLFREPTAFLNEFARKIEDNVTRKVTQSYSQEKQREMYWNQFYEQNKDLKDKKFLVDAVYAHDFQALAEMPIESGMKELATRARKRLADLIPADTRRPEQSHMEGGSPRMNTPPVEDKEGEPKTLGDVVRLRRQRAAGKSS